MWGCLGVEREKQSQLQDKLFLKNGGLVLEERITYFDGKSNPFRVFSKEELRRATNNYDQNQIIHGDLTYRLYKGIHEDRDISVKKFIDGCESYIGWYINEVVVASQMNNHMHVLKFLGCCLETEVPILVYEFAENGDLFDHIIKEDDLCSNNGGKLSWEDRLRIAMEVADTITYLHTGTSKCIIHRDIKSRNIFLDENYGSKLFEFGLSLAIPPGETKIKAELDGSFGFFDPDSLSTGEFSMKSDVYGFGVLLLEILTGKKATQIFAEIYDATGDSSLTEKNEKVHEMYIKDNVLKEGNVNQVMACGRLAMRCIKEKLDGRPTMKEVAQELRRIRRT
ncbi:hypothetical protein GIB67_033746 [Kingdonia uniflora]|uniref:Protein kinase domain-containing protein n=1 Tax=Kingdonia uniflora TaxID=39325 RepID=A0A7J7P510_9MAGN|nr:hypothetical protein GIB67_033746 [Kingdonia uniflora]